MANEVVGIDLGTTYSLAATMKDGHPEVIRDAHGVALVPSVLSFHEDGSVLVGSVARERALSDPDQTVYSVKRLMGRTLADLEQELKLIPYQVVERELDSSRTVLHVRIGDREFTPEELSARILRELRSRAGNPSKAVITVPAYFDDAQRQATRDAGRIAGLDVLRIVNEPTAAALAYGLQEKRNGKIAVYDLGGGTFDCSILSLADGVFKVLSTNGDTFLGGDDFDRALMQLVIDEQGLNDQPLAPEALQTLRDRAEAVKIQLSQAEEATFKVGLSAHRLDFTRTITRAEFEALITPAIERTLEKCRLALRDAELKPAEIDEVVLVGGSTRIPVVRQRVGAFFGRTPHTELNPDEVVALGAAVQADILTGGSRHMLLLDVVPLSLGIETRGGVVDKLIHRNTTIPTKATTRYTTSVDNQTAVKINIYQGERELTRDCRLLGEFTLSNLPPMAAHMPQVDVTFLVDANGLLTVSAVENRSGQQAKVSVQAGHGLSPEEIERLVLESVEHAQADFTARRLIELRSKAEGDLSHTAKALTQAGAQLPAVERERIAAAQSALEEAMQAQNVDQLQARVAEFGQATQPLAELLMNSVVKQTLYGKDADHLDANI